MLGHPTHTWHFLISEQPNPNAYPLPTSKTRSSVSRYESLFPFPLSSFYNSLYGHFKRYLVFTSRNTTGKQVQRAIQSLFYFIILYVYIYMRDSLWKCYVGAAAILVYLGILFFVLKIVDG